MYLVKVFNLFDIQIQAGSAKGALKQALKQEGFKAKIAKETDKVTGRATVVDLVSGLETDFALTGIVWEN